MIRPIAALTLSLVSGCSTTPPILPTVIPSELREPCPDLPKLPARDLGEVILLAQEWAALYGQCRERHRALADAVGQRR